VSAKTPVLLLLLAWLWAAVAAPTAEAGDANSAPPRIVLTAGGQEGLIGPAADALAYFSTSDLGSAERDSSAEYAKGSKVTFKCSLDGRPIRCPAEYLGTSEVPTEVLLRRRSRGPRAKALPGPFEGYVPVPKNLPSGPHTVTVVATDEDGTDPEPPSVTVTMDRTPPSAPLLTQVPPHRSRIRKPVFRFSASDDQRLVRHRGETFVGSLRRLQPPGVVYRSSGDADSFLAIWFPQCPSLLECSTRAEADYLVGEHWYAYGERERLTPGIYELRVRARDAVLNKSPITAYRFRILRGKAA
jgi:hypothetical protein